MSGICCLFITEIFLSKFAIYFMQFVVINWCFYNIRDVCKQVVGC